MFASPCNTSSGSCSYQKSLWGDFLKAKYCQRANPIVKKWQNGNSLMWKYMLKNWLAAEQHIQWILNSGTSCFWWDDWLGIGPLVNYRTFASKPNNITTDQLLLNGQWDEVKVR